MFSLLKQPFPLEQDNKRKIIISFAFGIFIFIFLFIFRPFGLHNLNPENEMNFFLTYGIITTSVLLFHSLILIKIFPHFYIEEDWTVLKEIINILLIVFNVGLINALFTALYVDVISKNDLNFFYIIKLQLLTFLIAIIPVTIHVLIKNLRLIRSIRNTSIELSDNLNHKKRLASNPHVTVEISSENKHESFAIKAIDLLIINSADNYVKVIYKEDGIIKSKLIRTTLKAAREDLRSFTAFYRCHRAWIVNLDYIIRITGNSQGLKLVIFNEDLIIPVSRSLNDELKLRITK